MSIEQLADREFARNVGHENPDQCWVLSDRDVWYRNPFYTGPVQRHPEDDSDLYDEGMIDGQDNLVRTNDAADYLEGYAAGQRSRRIREAADDLSDDWPF